MENTRQNGCAKRNGAAEIKDDLDFFVVLKSRNLRQDSDGNLSLLNYHFFAEIFVSAGRSVRQARLYRRGAENSVLAFRPHSDDVLGDNAWYAEGGWFGSEDDLDAAFPNGVYVFDITTPSGRIRAARLDFSHAGAKNEIPDPAVIKLTQNGVTVAPHRLDPHCETTVTWGDYAVGRADPNGIIDDQVFVVVADCFGNRIVKSGLSFEPSCLSYRNTDYIIPAGTLLPGRPHSMFVELPHVADSIVRAGVPGFASFATATYLQLHTLGKATGTPCPEKPVALDTGETDHFTPRIRAERGQLNRHRQ
jgi:hypothetical protein